MSLHMHRNIFPNAKRRKKMKNKEKKKIYNWTENEISTLNTEPTRETNKNSQLPQKNIDEWKKCYSMTDSKLRRIKEPPHRKFFCTHFFYAFDSSLFVASFVRSLVRCLTLRSASSYVLKIRCLFERNWKFQMHLNHQFNLMIHTKKMIKKLTKNKTRRWF